MLKYINTFMNDYWQIVKKHLKNLIIFFIGINIISFLSFGSVFKEHINQTDIQMHNNVVEYDEIDREQLCKIAHCTGVYSEKLNKFYTVDEKNHLQRGPVREINLISINDKIFFDMFEIYLYNNDSETYYLLIEDEYDFRI